MRKSVMLGVMLATVMFWAVTVSASSITIYTDKTQWINALGGQFLTEEFSDSQLNDGVSFVSTESGHINPTLEHYQDVLTSESQNEPMTTWSFTPEVYGYGGNWTLGGPGGSGNSLLVYIADSSLLVGTIPNSYGGEFWGFISDTPFTSVQLVGGSGTNQQNYTLDNMVYSDETAVSAPGARSELASINVSVYPNPFNPRTTFSFEISEQEHVSLAVYDLAGRRVAALVEQVMSAGTHTINWDASRLASGMYVYRLESSSETVSGRVTLVK